MGFIDIEMVIRIDSSVKESIVGILTILGPYASVIALLMGIEKEGKRPFSNEPPIQNTGGLRWPNSIAEGDP